MADIPKWLYPSPHSDFEVLDIGAHLYNDAGAFVARGADRKLRHRRDGEVVEHIVNIRVAEACGIELEEDLVRAWT